MGSAADPMTEGEVAYQPMGRHSKQEQINLQRCGMAPRSRRKEANEKTCISYSRERNQSSTVSPLSQRQILFKARLEE